MAIRGGENGKTLTDDGKAVAEKAASGSRQFLQALRHRSSHPQHGRHQGFIHIQVSFVFGEVAPAMSLVQDAPLFGRQVHGVDQALEHLVPVRGPVPVETQGGYCQGMGGVIGQVETAVEIQVSITGIGQPAQPGLPESVDFPGRRRLSF